MIAGDEFSILNAATLDGKIHQWKLIDDQRPSALDVSSFKLLGLHDRFSLEYTGSVETSVGCVTSVCHNSKRLVASYIINFNLFTLNICSITFSNILLPIVILGYSSSISNN